MESVEPKDWSDGEVMQALQDRELPINKARARFSHHAALIEQSVEQPKPPGPIEIRRMEFQAAHEIIKAFNGEP